MAREKRYTEWIKEHRNDSGYGWVKYRLHSSGTTKVWHFWELAKFRKFIAEHAGKFMWAMIVSYTDGAFYFFDGLWRKSSGARLMFFRDKVKGKVVGSDD